MMRPVLGGSRGIGLGLGFGKGSGAVAAWWLSGGVSAANAIAVYQAIGAASQAASYVNLANPGTFNASPGTAPTWASGTGWTFDGSSQYLTTGLTPSDTGWTALIRFVAGNKNGNSIIGYYGAGAWLVQQNIGTNMTVYNGLPYPDGYCANSQDVRGIDTVYGFAGKQPYKNGAAEATVIPAGTGSFGNIFVGAGSFSGTPDQYYLGDMKAVAIYDTTLDAATVAAISAAMAALT